jgi:hypothetical protein
MAMSASGHTSPIKLPHADPGARAGARDAGGRGGETPCGIQPETESPCGSPAAGFEPVLRTWDQRPPVASYRSVRPTSFACESSAIIHRSERCVAPCWRNGPRPGFIVVRTTSRPPSRACGSGAKPPHMTRNCPGLAVSKPRLE